MGEIRTSNGQEILPEETLKSLEALGSVLLRIRKRMISEGFDIIDGEIVKSSIIKK